MWQVDYVVEDEHGNEKLSFRRFTDWQDAEEFWEDCIEQQYETFQPKYIGK